MQVAYTHSDEIREKYFSEKQNYWDTYFGEILGQLGVSAKKLTWPECFSNPGIWEEIEVLLVGEIGKKEYASFDWEILSRWVRNGGILIGSKTLGMDSLFGNKPADYLKQSSEIELRGYMEFRPGSLTEDIPPPYDKTEKLPIFSDIRLIECNSSNSLADLYDKDGKALPYPAVTENKWGKGTAYYFTFSLPQVVWLLHQGKKVSPEGVLLQGVRYCKTTDLSLIGQNSADIPYADELLLFLENMIAERPIPFIHQFPPDRGEIPEALFFWGGDDEGIAGTQVASSNWMKEKSLPYHINTLWRNGEFSISPQEKKKIEENGHELSLHYNFIDRNKPPFHFSREDIQRQNRDYQRYFKSIPLTTVNHFSLWQGWSEPAEWMAKCKGLGDNSFYYHFSDSIPLFAFGTAFTFFFYTDWKKGNRRINFIEQPISGYELGYGHIAKKPEDTAIDTEVIHRTVNIAAYYNCCLNMFYHSYRISDWPACRSSIEEILNYVKKKKLNILHMANDRLTKWWFSRDRSQIDILSRDKGKIKFKVRSDWPEGIIVKLPWKSNRSLFINGISTEPIRKRKFGREWTYIILPKGENILEVIFGKEKR
jgi:hypothetical protein